MTRRETMKQEFIRRVTRPGQSASMTEFLNKLVGMDDEVFEVWLLPALAYGDMPEAGNRQRKTAVL